MNTSDILNIGVLAIASIFAFKGYKKFFGDSSTNDNLSTEQEIDFSEQTQRYSQEVTPKEMYPDSNWSRDFNYTDIEQSKMTPTDTNIRTTDEEGNLSSYKFNPDDLTAPQRRAFNLGLWDFEDGVMQFGIGQGIQRKLRGGLGEDELFTQEDKLSSRDFFNQDSVLQHSQTDLFINTSKTILPETSVFNQKEEVTHAERRTSGGGGSVVRDSVVVLPITQQERTESLDTAQTYGSDAFKRLAERVL